MTSSLPTQTVVASAASADRVRTALAAALDGGPALLPLPTDTGPAAALRAVADAAAVPPGTALLVPTSGSTGTPKLVTLSAAALRASATGTELALGGKGQWLLALPTTHIAGLQVLTRSLLAGTSPVVLDAPRFAAEPFAAATARLTHERRCTALVPTQLRRLLDSDVGTQALLRYDAVLVGGAATSPSLLAAARAAGVAVRTTYGMSETAGGCLYDGRPIGGASYALDESGRIRLAGPTLASGYLGAPELTAEAFVDGWFVTADLGRVDAAGALQVLGRADDVVVTGGLKVHPLAVEAVLARAAGVVDVCVAGVPDPEWGAVVTAWVVGAVPGGPDPAALREAVRAELGAAAVPREVHVVEAIPLLVSGKPDRRRLVASATRRRQ